MSRLQVEKYQNTTHHVENNQKKTLNEIFIRIIIYLIFCTTFYVFLSFIFPSAFPNANLTNLTQFIYIFTTFYGIFLFWFFLSLIIIPLTLITFFRTKYTGYLAECLISVQNVVIALFTIYVLFFNINVVLLGLVYVSIILSFYENSNLRKPLFWDKRFTYYQQKYFDQRKDVLFKQAQSISKFEDGYSTRPVILDFSDILTENTNGKYLLDTTIRFGKFLAKKGDLIGYSVTNQSNYQSKVKFYLRTGLLKKENAYFEVFLIDIFWDPLTFLRTIFNVLMKRNLTTVTFDLSTKEMSFKLNKFDYEIMNNVTFHLLSENVLNKFKTSFKYYLKEDIVKSYRTLFPDDLSSLKL